MLQLYIGSRQGPVYVKYAADALKLTFIAVYSYLRLDHLQVLTEIFWWASLLGSWSALPHENRIMNPHTGNREYTSP